MNYLIISPNSPFLSIGGIERYMQNLMDYCKDQPGHFYFLLPSASKDKIVKKGHVTIHFKSCLNLSYRKRKNTSGRRTGGREVYQKSDEFYKFLNKFVEKKKINAVIAQNFHLGMPPSYSLMLNMVCHAKKVPLFLQVHSFATSSLQSEIINSLFWKKVLCVSKSVAGDCFNKGLGINRVTTKYLGVNSTVFTKDQNNKWLKKHLKLKQSDKVILCASRILQGYSDILKEKGIINLLDAFSKVRQRKDNVYLVLAVGKPPRRLSTEFEAALRKLEGYIQIHGVKDAVIVKTFALDKMPRVYAGADVFALPSENETFGQVFIEAMACGLPTIGTNVGGVPEIITDNKNGILVQPNNASKLAQGIERLLEDEVFRTKLIQNGRKTVSRLFDSKKLFDHMFQFITKHSTK